MPPCFCRAPAIVGNMSDAASTQPAFALAREVLRIEAEAVAALGNRLQEGFAEAVRLMLECRGRVVVTGLGKSGLIARKIAATLNSTGAPALYLHPAEALHGDLGALAAGDVVMALSYGGETEELLKLLAWIQRLGLQLIALTGAPGSTLGRNAQAVLDVSVAREACPHGLAPTASTTAALAMGDALAMTVAAARGFDASDFAELHPGGRLGRQLTPVEELMHAGEKIPRVSPEASFSQLLYEMSRKGLGMTTVVDEQGKLLGLISDGDLRRLLERHGAAAVELRAADCMTARPVTIPTTMLAPAALRLMETRKITSLPVIDNHGMLAGVVHLHDLWASF